MRIRLLLTAVALVVGACSGSSADDTTTSTEGTTTSEATTTTVDDSTTTTEETTTTEATTTTEPEDTTTTSEGEGDTTTTTEATEDTTTTTVGDTTSTTFPPPPTTSSTTIAESIAALEPYVGVFRQPTAYANFVQFRADGILRAGDAYDNMPFEGTWEYDTANDTFILDIDVAGTACAGALGIYSNEDARGGGRRLTVVEDPCEDRIDFFTLPGSPCMCMTWLEVNDPEED